MEGQRRVYKCRKCGQPKKGHVCTYDESTSSVAEAEPPSTKAKAHKSNLLQENPQEEDKDLPLYFVVLDLEATCDEDWNRNFYPQEIIEFSAVLWSTATHEVEDTFQVYVKPLVHPVLTPFCHHLTGIHQEWVDNGASLQECLQMFHEWLERHDLLLAPRPTSTMPASTSITTTSSAFWLATWSDWDLGTMLEAQCIRTCLDKEPYFNQWVDLKQLYMRYYSKKFRVKLSEAVASLGLGWEGAEHCALDDCRNTSRLLGKIIEHGHPVYLTSALPHAP
ncbi:exonuclease [Acanthamoeba castellanii str. Neff]|uniref:Exonuclease n=1 Tax=Acanthamoeba castellanii (strain ATCC 30010 / Neff) TaxID=1257118 RepID=L8GHR9_ACACF|nr:exonuclease [Acanthamoeba castellanii str. Neff]ELR12308.1 exonuclease [Acanthamoeba castellanii str. Neff]